MSLSKKMLKKKKSLNTLPSGTKEEKEQEEDVKPTGFPVTVQPVFKLSPERGSISICSLIKWV